MSGEHEGQGLGAHPNKASDEINETISRHQQAIGDWPLAEWARTLHSWCPDLWRTFMPKAWEGMDTSPPSILLRFQDDHPSVLGHYVKGRNDLGLQREVSLNPRCMAERSQVQVAADLLHELLHCFEDLAGIAPASTNNYHSTFFRRISAQWGTPCTKYGRDLGIDDPSPFMKWARSRGLNGIPIRLENTTEAAAAKHARSLPKRVTWTCVCPEGVRVIVHVARGQRLLATCGQCSESFLRDCEECHHRGAHVRIGRRWLCASCAPITRPIPSLPARSHQTDADGVDAR